MAPTTEPRALAVLAGAALIFAACCAPSEFPPHSHAEPPPWSGLSIELDAWCIATIRGLINPDVAYGVAWAHAEDDLPAIAEAKLAAQGAA